MGKSEWGFLIKNKEDLKHVIDFVSLHNNWKNDDEIGEELYFICVFVYDMNTYCCVGSEGGRHNTSLFIEKHYKGKNKVFYPFDKPSWWFLEEEQKSLWRASVGSTTPVLDIII
jgi:hypothetical protein